ncbi:MAG: hypothetical protein AB1846_15360 [Chloroflexota bacterium]
MPRHRHQKKEPKSPFPVSQPETHPRQPVTDREEILAYLETLFSKEKAADVLDYIDELPRKISREPEIRLMYALALLDYGDKIQGGQVLREIERRNPRFAPVYPVLAGWYLASEFPAHVYRTIEKAKDFLRAYDKEAYQGIQGMKAAAAGMLEKLAEAYNLSFERAEQASWHHEQAQIAQSESNPFEAERMAREALKTIPTWNSPRNNRANALLSLGRVAEAISEAEIVVANDPDNVHGLKNLTHFHYGLGQLEKAQEYAGRLFELASVVDFHSFDIDIIVTALATIEDTVRLWALAQKFVRKHADALLSRSWYCLAIAAARTGQFKDAQKLLKRSISQEESQPANDLLEEVNHAIANNSKKLLWPPMYPGMELFDLERIIQEWTKIAENVEDDQPTPKQQKKINAFMEKYPFALQFFKRMLWNEKTSELGASALVILNQPEADAEVLRFATSDWGDNDNRMEAAMTLSKAGRYQLDKPLKFWDAKKGEWHEVQMFTQQIGEVEYDIKPATADLIEKARQAEEPQETIALLRKAVEDDPTCAMALHNLGVVVMNQGDEEEGEGLMRRSIEVDPTYTFGYANLGLLEAKRGNKEAALDLLAKVNQTKIIAPNTAALANLAYATLALEDEDIEGARRHFDLAEQFHPENVALEGLRERLELLEKFGGMTDFFRNYQKQSANRYHKKMLKTPLSENMDLEACLATMTTDNLSAICAFWKIQGYGKKKEKVARLVARILDQDIFVEIFENIEEDERTALEDVLNQGGRMPWNQFIEKFGDDMDESDYWKYHEPESIPGRLKRAGLLFVGKLNGQEVAFIPVEVHPLLQDALGRQ